MLSKEQFRFRTNSTQEDYDAAYALGMIRKEDLVVGASYEGHCRNASTAVWHGDHFVYMRTKFGSTYEEDIKYPTDEQFYDVFIPWKKLNAN